MSNEHAKGAVLQKIPIQAVAFLLTAVGFVGGLTLFPIPPYSNVAPAATIPIVLLFGGTLGFLEVKSRVA